MKILARTDQRENPWLLHQFDYKIYRQGENESVM